MTLHTLATATLSLGVCALPCTGEELTPELLKEQAAQWVWRLRCTGLMLGLPSLDEAAEDLKGIASYDGEHLQPGSYAGALLERAVDVAAMMVSTCSMVVMPARRLRPSVGMASSSCSPTATMQCPALWPCSMPAIAASQCRLLDCGGVCRL